MTPSPCPGTIDRLVRLKRALETASMVRNRWREGAPADLDEVLARHPELKQHRTVVLDLAYDAYCLRQEAGERLEPEEFSQRFQSLEWSLYFLILVHSELGSNSELASLLGDVPWPELKSRFLGFELISAIGQGAIGRVFLAFEVELQRRVVVKVALGGSAEAKILAHLEHRNIVTVYSVDEDPETGLTAFCMPDLGRATLASVFEGLFAGGRRPLRAQAILDAVAAANQGVEVPDRPPPDQILLTGSYVEGVIHLGVQLAEALAHAHARGIFHRDLKPSNILMAPEGQPQLLDFNLSVDERQPVWRVGGTLPYMAPEELSAFCNVESDRNPPHYDPRSDLFSLGVILYELLAGSPPFGVVSQDRPAREAAARLRLRQAEGPTPLRKHNCRVDKHLERLIARCLAVHPDDRPENAETLAAALRRELRPVRRLRRWAATHPRTMIAAERSCWRSFWARPDSSSSVRLMPFASSGRASPAARRGRTNWRWSASTPPWAPNRTGARPSLPVPAPTSSREIFSRRLPITTPPTSSPQALGSTPAADTA